MSMVSE